MRVFVYKKRSETCGCVLCRKIGHYSTRSSSRSTCSSRL